MYNPYIVPDNSGDGSMALGNAITTYFFEKLKIPQLTTVEMWESVTGNYPRYYPIIFFLTTLFYLLVACGIFLASIFWFQKLQLNMFGKNALFFISGDGLFIFHILNFLGIIMLVGVMLSVVIYPFSNSNFKMYMRKRAVESGLAFREKYALLAFTIIVLIYYLLITPIFYMGFNNYFAIYENKIVNNNFLKHNSYSINDVNHIGYFLKTVHGDNHENDSKKWSKVNAILVINKKQISVDKNLPEFYDEINKLNIKYFLIKPSMEDIMLLNYSPEKEKQIYKKIFNSN